MFLIIISWFLSGLSGLLLCNVGLLMLHSFLSDPEKEITGWIGIILSIILGVAFAGVGVFAFGVAVAVAFAGAGIVAVYGTVCYAFLGACLINFTGASLTTGFVNATFPGAKDILIVVPNGFAVTFAFSLIFTGAFGLLGIYIAWRAMKGDGKYTIVRNIAIAFAAFKGTSFRNADLTDADFSLATLKSTDFRKANLTRTCCKLAKKLDRVRPGTSYLKHTQLQQVLITGQGQEKNFDRFDLRGVNFKGAILTDASFIGANLNEANLQSCDLSRAKLVQAQLDGTDFTGATLTGAYIKDWNITSDTKFDGVQCEYVYMQLPTKENPDPLRKPDNNKEVFADGEFGDFIKPIFDTLDLYHNQGVDPRAIAISFKQLAENHPDAELEIVAMEKRGEDKFLLRAKTVLESDKSQLSQQYFEIYNQLKALTEKEIQKLITEKDSRIRSLENFVETALQRPSFYAEKYQNQGNTMSEAPKYNFNNPKFGGGFSGDEGTTIGGTLNDYSSNIDYSSKQTLAEAAAEIQQLLYQLSLTNPTTNEAVTEAIYQEIRRNHTLKTRLQSALKAGGLEALKAIFNHPLFNIPVETIKGWLEAE